MMKKRVTLYNRGLIVALKICSLALLCCLWAAAIGTAQSISSRITGAGAEQADGPRWSLTGNLNTARSGHTATLLTNGKVLVAGGGNGDSLNSAELYDPATGTWSGAGALNTGRGGHIAVLLPNGKVLVAGGVTRTGSSISVINSAELYDPATGTWSGTGALNMGRRSHTATLLPNGKVLVTGGLNDPLLLDSAELYDPATGIWSLTGNLKTARSNDTATLLHNGKVLVTGGYIGAEPYFLSSTELYDPVTGTWSSADNLNRRGAETAILLPNGEVLVVEYDSAELYDPETERWSVTGNLNISRDAYTATLLPNGQVLIAGGFNYNDDTPFFTPELYDPATGTWSSAGKLNRGRYHHTATLLANGKVLVVGGLDPFNSPLNSAELFDLALTQSGTVTNVSAASFSLMGLASEALTASFGARLASATQSATAIPPPTSLAETTVKVKDSAGIERLAPLFFVSPTQVNYQIPAGTAPGAATVTITSGDGAVSTGVALVNKVAPSLFTANGAGQGAAAALALRIKADGSQQLEPVAQFDAAENKFVARSLDLGPETDQVYLLLFGTGIRQRNSRSSAITTIGGVYAEVSFAGAQGAFVGLDQTNVLVPRSLAGRGEVDVLLTVEAQMTNAVRVNIK